MENIMYIYIHNTEICDKQIVRNIPKKASKYVCF